MPRLTWEFQGDAFADGAGDDRFLIDLSEDLSQLYGKMIRQGQVFRVRQIDIRLINPNTLVQDEVMAVAGNLSYFHPTKPRKEAWRNAYQTVQQNRRALGIRTGSKDDYDFRVGYLADYSTDVGAWGEGVKFNAWVNADDDPLCLDHTTVKNSVFGVYNRQHQTSAHPANQDGGFGHWAQKDADAIADELDFITNETEYFSPELASAVASKIPFQVAFSNVFDNSVVGIFRDHGGTTSAQHCLGPYDVMCGLLGVQIDTTTVDDSETQTQDWRIQISVDIESWSLIGL